MTNEDASVIIGNIPIEGDDCYTIAEYQEAKAKAIQALEAQPSEDTEVIKVSKGVVKARQGRFVIYDVDWLKRNFYSTEEKIYGQPKQSCEDCISRDEAIQELELKKKAHLIQGNTRMVDLCDLCIKAIKTKPCEDAISRSDLLQKIQEAPTHLNETWDELYDSVIDDINSMPAVTPQTVTEFADKCKECGKIQNEFFNFDAPMVKKSDAVSREAVIRLVDQYPNIIGNRCSGLIADIKHLPSVIPKYTDEEIDKAQAVEQAYVEKMVELAVEEAKRPKGKWIETLEQRDEFGSTWHYECSKCRARSYKGFEPLERYCPNCGAKMEVEE